MSESNKITLNVEGMTCANCALGIKKQLEKKGLEGVIVNFSTGEASYVNTPKVNVEEVRASISSLGFKVVDEIVEEEGLSLIEKKFYFSLIFTIPLFLHMFFGHDFILNNVWVQLALCTPVFLVGLSHFGKSAFGSLKTGVPNMDVLIVIGITSAFGYSLYGTMTYLGMPEAHNFLFYETAATITTLVLLGNVLEHRSVKQTTTAIKELNQLQKTKVS